MKLRLLLLLALLPVSALAETVDLGARGYFLITVPRGWKFSATKAGDFGYTATLKPEGDAHIKCLLTILYLQRPEPVDRRKLESDVLNAVQQFVDGSVEKKANLRSFNVSKGYGAYAVFTDAALVGAPPLVDDYKVLGSGIVKYTDDVIAVVSMYCDDARSTALATMVKAVESSVVNPRGISAPRR